jgi:hypothetical protein
MARRRVDALMRSGVASRIVARTTINLDPTVLRELKARSAREQRPIGEVASDLLAAALKQSPTAAPTPAFQWRTFDMGEPMVDLYDREAMREALDGA